MCYDQNDKFSGFLFIFFEEKNPIKRCFRRKRRMDQYVDRWGEDSKPVGKSLSAEENMRYFSTYFFFFFIFSEQILVQNFTCVAKVMRCVFSEVSF